MPKIMYINNDGGGFASNRDVEEGTTISKLFAKDFPDSDSSNYLIRVNRQPTTGDYVLQEGDRVTVTPTKVEGAA